jgi:hypothetical protein
MIQPEWTTISPEQAKERGLAPVSIRINARAAGLSALFPTKDVYLAISGPPGGANLIMI